MDNLFSNYVNSNTTSFIPEEKIQEMLQEYRIHKNISIRNKIVENYYPMMLGIINSKVYDIDNREDYISTLVMSLIKAIDDYDLGSDTSFKTFAYTYMSNGLRNESNNNNGLIHVPYTEYVNATKYMSAKKKLEDKYNRKLSLEELSEILDIKPKKILDYENELSSLCSLNEPVGENTELGDIISDSISLEESVIKNDEESSIMDKIKLLKDKREQLIILYTYGLIDGIEHTQEEACLYLEQSGFKKMSRQGVQKLQKKALQELKEMYS